MKHLLAAPALLVLLAPAWAGETKTAAPKVGGPFEVEVTKDQAYFTGDDADKVRHKLDLYLPRGQKDYPVLFFVHGGAWVSGNKNLYEPLGKMFAKNGIGCVVINYRLTPAVQHPGHIEDVARAFAWTHQNIAKYGGRPDRIFVCGHSAGGHLVALLSTNEKYLKKEKLDITTIRGTIPLSGVFQIEPNFIFEKAFGKDKEVCLDASPIEHVIKGKQPPCLMIYAEKDIPMLDVMAENMCKKLKTCDCQAATMKLTNRDHISIIVMMINETDPGTQAILGFIAKHADLKLKEK